jgi:hypothetical protein
MHLTFKANHTRRPIMYYRENVSKFRAF